MATVSAPPASPDLDGYGTPPGAAWPRIDWSRYQRWVEIDGRPVNVIDIGDGPPLLFIHGHAGCWQNWLENIPHFAERHRVVAFDLPGFGWSPMPSADISITNYALIADGLCDELGIDAAAVVGNSMGGFIAAELAIRSPRRVERLGLIAAAGLSRRYMRIPISVMASPYAGGKVMLRVASAPYERARKLARRRRLRELSLWAVVRHPSRLSPPMAAYLIAGSGRPGGAPAAIALATYDFRERLGEIACPTLVLWGENDFVIDVSAADRYERAIENSRKVILPDTGHVAMVERPARFNAELELFLNE